MNFNVNGFDMHIHSSHSSDGVLSPFQILTAVRSNGINMFSITDHNTVAACNEIKWHREKFGSKTLFINGVELSTFHGDREIHVLAYGFDESCTVLAQIMETFQRNRDFQTQMRVEKLQDMGFVLEHEELVKASQGRTASGVTFLKVLSGHPENHKMLYDYLEGEKAVSPFTNFYFDYFVKGGKAWVDVRLLDFFDVVDKMKNNAILSIAHPALYKDRKIEELLIDGIRGIEAYSTYHDADKVSYYLDVAKKNKLFITAGSDFHGERIKPGIRLGGHGCSDVESILPFVDAVMETGCGSFYI